MVLTVSFALSLVIGFLVTVISRIASVSAPGWADTPPQDLTPASRRQDHTTSPSASRAVRQQHVCVHRIPSRVRDDRDTPLEWDETAALMDLIWGKREGIYFCKRGWTTQITLNLNGKFSAACNARTGAEWASLV